MNEALFIAKIFSLSQTCLAVLASTFSVLLNVSKINAKYYTKPIFTFRSAVFEWKQKLPKRWALLWAVSSVAGSHFSPCTSSRLSVPNAFPNWHLALFFGWAIAIRPLIHLFTPLFHEILEAHSRKSSVKYSVEEPKNPQGVYLWHYTPEMYP